MASFQKSASMLARRGYASAAAVKAPVQLNSLSGVYATSTYLAALKKSSKELDSVAKSFIEVEKKIEGSKELGDFLVNPTLSDSQRKTVIESLAPSGTSPVMTNLLLVLAENGRLPLFPTIVSDFSTLMSAHNGQLIVTVTSAEPLAAGGKELSRLEKALKGSKVAQGKSLKIVNKVNPSVLGGLMVDFGDQTIDLTASSKVTKFSAALGGEQTL